MSNLSLILKESNGQIESKIKNALVKEVDRVMNRAVIKVVNPIRELVKKTLLEQPEVLSLGGGQLAGEFGLPDGGRRIENIINFWTKNIIVSKKKATASGSQLSAGFTIDMIRKDFEDVIGLSDSTITTEKGQELPWLEWLLKFGDRAIIRDYEVDFVNSKRSRSGLAIMVQNSKRNWRVPSQFSGTVENNFVTRALDSIEDDIVSILEKQLRSVI